MNIVIVKLKTGEEFVAEEVCQYTFKNPVVPVQAGPDQMALQPWCPMSVDREFKFSHDDLMIPPREPVAAIREAYDQTFGSGIVLPNKELLRG